VPLPCGDMFPSAPLPRHWSAHLGHYITTLSSAHRTPTRPSASCPLPRGLPLAKPTPSTSRPRANHKAYRQRRDRAPVFKLSGRHGVLPGRRWTTPDVHPGQRLAPQFGSANLDREMCRRCFWRGARPWTSADVPVCARTVVDATDAAVGRMRPLWCRTLWASARRSTTQ
jgi:hypothetical protein